MAMFMMEMWLFYSSYFYFIKDSRVRELSRLFSSRREGQGGLGLITGKGVFCVRNFFFPSTVTHVLLIREKGEGLMT